MTQDRNDRRRRPQRGTGPQPGGRPQGQGGPRNSQNPPSRHPQSDGTRRGFTPDSGYRPAGSQPANDPSRGRTWGGRDQRRSGPSQGPQGPRGSGTGSPPSGNYRGPRDRNDRGPSSGPSTPSGYPPRRDDNRPRYNNPRPEKRYPDTRRPEGYRGNDPRRPPQPSYRDQGPRRDPRDERNPRPAVPASGAPAAAPSPTGRTGKIDAFELFCAYHLGITPDKKFRHANLSEVARRFGIGPGEIKQALQDFGMDAAVVMEKDFDMALAQLDIELAPEGIDRVELARQIYADYLEAPRRKIDWKKIIEDDIRENAKVFGRKD